MNYKIGDHILVLDNTVLSAYTRLKLLPFLREIFPKIVISRKIHKEYSKKWKKNLPNWIEIIISEDNITLEGIPVSLSSSDLSVIRLGLQYNYSIASDDIPLRNYAKKVGLQIVGSLGLLKLLYQERVIPNQAKYEELIDLLSEDVYISDKLKKWALEK